MDMIGVNGTNPQCWRRSERSTLTGEMRIRLARNLIGDAFVVASANLHVFELHIIHLAGLQVIRAWPLASRFGQKLVIPGTITFVTCDPDYLLLRQAAHRAVVVGDNELIGAVLQAGGCGRFPATESSQTYGGTDERSGAIPMGARSYKCSSIHPRRSSPIHTR